MQTKPKKSLNFIDPPVTPEGGREFANTRIGLALIAAAERAYVLRDEQGLMRIAEIMCRDRMPSDLREIGRYYLGVSLLHKGLLSDCAPRLRSVAENGPRVYRARAFLALAATERLLGDRPAALEMYDAAEKAAAGVDIRAYCQARKMKAVSASEEGDHAGALKQLHRISPVARAAARMYPLIAYDQLNSVALELAENRRQSEAVAIAESMGSWPVLNTYPEFADTRDSLLRLQRTNSRLFLPRDTPLSDNTAMAAPRIERIEPVPDQQPGKLLPFSRARQQAEEGDAIVVMLKGFKTPLYDGPVTEKQLKRLYRFLQSL